MSSNSELSKNLITAGPQKLTASEIKYEKFWTKIFSSSLKNGYFGALVFQEIAFFVHIKYNFKTLWPQKIWIFKVEFTAKITLISMIKKMPLTFLDA